jgi:hypothetical protein
VLILSLSLFVFSTRFFPRWSELRSSACLPNLTTVVLSVLLILFVSASLLSSLLLFSESTILVRFAAASLVPHYISTTQFHVGPQGSVFAMLVEIAEESASINVRVSVCVMFLGRAEGSEPLDTPLLFLVIHLCVVFRPVQSTDYVELALAGLHE